MLSKIIGRKIVYLVSGLFFLFSLSTFSYGETDYGSILGTDDKGELKRILKEAEKVLENNPKDVDSITKRGIVYHNIAHSKEKGVAKTCVKYLKKDTKTYPEDPLLLALLGSCTTMMGRDASDIGNKMRYVNSGAGIIDRAIMKSPDHVLARMVRANNSTGIPRFFKRRKFTKIDLLHIEKIIKESPQKVTADLQAQVYYKLGKIYITEGNPALTESCFKKAVEVSPDSKWGKMARKGL